MIDYCIMKISALLLPVHAEFHRKGNVLIIEYQNIYQTYDARSARTRVYRQSEAEIFPYHDAS